MVYCPIIQNIGLSSLDDGVNYIVYQGQLVILPTLDIQYYDGKKWCIPFSNNNTFVLPYIEIVEKELQNINQHITNICKYEYFYHFFHRVPLPVMPVSGMWYMQVGIVRNLNE